MSEPGGSGAGGRAGAESARGAPGGSGAGGRAGAECVRGAPGSAPAGARLERLDPVARAAVTSAEEEARLLGHDEIGDDHLLLGVARVAPELIGLPIEALRARVAAGRGSETRGGASATRSDAAAARIVALASEAAVDHPVRPADLLAAIVEAHGRAADALARIGVDSIANRADD